MLVGCVIASDTFEKFLNRSNEKECSSNADDNPAGWFH
jgi:hypothetical protein